MSSHQYSTVQQKEMLVELLREHEMLRNGKFSSTFTFRDARNLWEGITEKLNSVPGARKDWKHWRKTWQDLRSKTKSKAARLNKERRGTGGGPSSTISFSQCEENVLGMMSSTVIQGHVESVESLVVEIDVDSEIGVVQEGVSENPPNSVMLEVDTESRVVPEVEYFEMPIDPTRRRTPLRAVKDTTLLLETAHKKLAIKEKYLKKKIELLTRQTEAMETQARAMESQARAMESQARSAAIQSEALEKISTKLPFYV